MLNDELGNGERRAGRDGRDAREDQRARDVDGAVADERPAGLPVDGSQAHPDPGQDHEADDDSSYLPMAWLPRVAARAAASHRSLPPPPPLHSWWLGLSRRFNLATVGVR